MKPSSSKADLVQWLKNLGPLAVAMLLLASPASARKEQLALRTFAVPLPGAPASIVPADLDGDGIGDLVVVVAFTEWGQIVTEESVEMDQVKGLVEMMTIVPAIADRRQLLVFRGLEEGGFEALTEPMDLGLSVLAVLAGPHDLPIVALTDHGLSKLQIVASEGSFELAFVPVLERRSVLSFSGALLPDLELVFDLDRDGRDDLIFPGRFGLDVYLAAADGLASSPTTRVPLPSDDSSGRRRRLYPLPTVADLDGDGLLDLLLRTGSDWDRFWVARNRGGGQFSELVEIEAEPPPKGELVHFGDLNGDGRGQYVFALQTDDEDVGWRKELKQAKVPHFRYFVHDSLDDFSVASEPTMHFDTTGYGFEGNDDIPLPFGLEDLDGDGRQDLITMTLGFSMLQAFRILATRSISVGIDFHLWCQEPDGSFAGVDGLDLSGKFKLRLDDLRIGQLSQFAGDFDGDGRADFVQLGRGRKVTLHLGREGCYYPPNPDLEIRLREEPKNLALVQVRDLDGDSLADLLVIQPQADSKDGVTNPVRLDLYLSRGSG